MIQVARIPNRIAPLTWRIYSTAVMNRPISASSAQMPAVWKLSVKLVMVTSVEESTDRPAFCRPMNAINRPMPTETPFLSVSGMALKIASRTLVNDSTIKTRPSIKTASSATCQL